MNSSIVDDLAPLGVKTSAMRVLVAEDDPTQRLVLERLLRRAGYTVESASDGTMALARILEGTFDILVTDLDMPGIDGTTLCQRIRDASLTNYLFILMLTSHTQDADAAAGLEAGADDFVRKPPSELELLARLKNGSRIVQLQRDSYRLSITDPLLGVFNRRYLMNQLRCEIWRSRRYQRPLSVLMADLDHFKQVNDRHGHAVGDQVLVGFTRRARSLIRETDWMARSGGEEFVFVLPETSVARALHVAEKVREGLADGPFLTSAGDLSVTASFGIAELALGTEEDAGVLLGRADEATYRSKEQGRNRVTTASESSRVAVET